MPSPVKVLVVDDSALMRKALKTMLVESGDVEVVLARNGEDALDVLSRERPDVVTLDINMPVMDGLTCLAEIMREQPTPVVMVSSLTEKGAMATLEALELGAVDYVAKPGGTVSLNMAEAGEELVAKVRKAAGARVRRGGSLTTRLRRQREEAAAAVPTPRRSTRTATPGAPRTAARTSSSSAPAPAAPPCSPRCSSSSPPTSPPPSSSPSTCPPPSPARSQAASTRPAPCPCRRSPAS